MARHGTGREDASQQIGTAECWEVLSQHVENRQHPDFSFLKIACNQPGLLFPMLPPSRMYADFRVARRASMYENVDVHAMSRVFKSRFPSEELANTLTHGLGLTMSIAGFVLLVVLAAMRGNAWRIVSCTVYGVTLVTLYAASTLYHSLHSRRLRRILRVCDHSAIYLLIAGTYTPFLLVNLRGGWGWSLFGVIWGLAMAGILFKVWFVEHLVVWSTAVYLLMGWLALLVIKPMLHAVPLSGILWLVAGGVMYSVGVVFFAWKKVPYNHAIWHGFVLAGSTCHYFAVLCAVILPTKAF